MSTRSPINSVNKVAFTFLHLPLYALMFLVSLMPISWLYRIAEVVFVLMYHVVGYRRSIVVQNLSRAFPERRYEEIADLSKRFYHSFSDWLAEIVKLVSLPSLKLRKQVKLINFEYVEQYLASGRNVVAGLGHFGNWEMLSILPQLLNKKVITVYKPMQNRIADRILHKIRSRFGMQMIASHQVARYMLSTPNDPALYLFIADQCPPVSDSSNSVVFLNQQTSILPGIERLSKATDAAVVYLFIKRERRGCYTIECMPICEDPSQSSDTSITASYVDLLEMNVQDCPENWLWTHKRWKR